MILFDSHFNDACDELTGAQRCLVSNDLKVFTAKEFGIVKHVSEAKGFQDPMKIIGVHSLSN